MAAPLAKKLRATTEHDAGLDKYDLGSFSSPEMTRELVQLAFAKPIPASGPLKFTFVVGGGKLVRSKYDVELPKWLNSALREIGFDDDRGAALGSQGAFKLQQDLGQNLVYMHVFPRVEVPSASAAEAVAALDAPLIITPTQRVLNTTRADFQKLIASRAPSWSEKRTVNTGELQAAIARLDSYEAKLASRVPLTEAEQSEYDSLSRELLMEKAEFLHKEIKAHVTGGKLTASEITTVLHEMDSKADKLKGDKSAAAAAALQALRERREAIAHLNPIPLAPLRGDAEMRKIRSRITGINKLEKSMAGRSYTIDQLREVNERPELEARLAALLKEARGWWEEEAAFRERVAAATGGSSGGSGGGKKGGK